MNNFAAKRTVPHKIANLAVIHNASDISRSPARPIIAGSNVYRTANTNIIPLANPANNCPNSLLKSDSKEPRNTKHGAIIVIAIKLGPKNIDSNSVWLSTCKTVSHQNTAYPAKIPPTIFALVCIIEGIALIVGGFSLVNILSAKERFSSLGIIISSEEGP